LKDTLVAELLGAQHPKDGNIIIPPSTAPLPTLANGILYPFASRMQWFFVQRVPYAFLSFLPTIVD